MIHVRPTAYGTADGSNWANAAGFSALPTLVAKAAPGSVIGLLSTEAYTAPTDMKFSASGGVPGSPVKIMGVLPTYQPAQAVFTGSRTAWTPPSDPEVVTSVVGWARGGEVFKINASNLHFSFMRFVNVGVVFDTRTPNAVENITLEDMSFCNALTFFDHGFDGSAYRGAINNLVLRRISGVGFSKSAIRLRGDTLANSAHHCVFEDVRLDSRRQNLDNFAVGFALDGFAHDITYRRCSSRNCHDSAGSYWNADGFSSEGHNANIYREDCEASGCTDGGFDDKATGIVMERCRAFDNKQNFRVWAPGAEFMDCETHSPRKRGGSGSALAYWVDPTKCRLTLKSWSTDPLLPL